MSSNMVAIGTFELGLIISLLSLGTSSLQVLNFLLG